MYWQTTETSPQPALSLHNHEPDADDLRQAALQSLGQCQRQLPCKYFYDERGSRLFDQICRLPEYYPTRTEMQIMKTCAADIAATVGPQAVIVEYGSGSSLKTRILLDHLESPAGYVPIDISREHLLRSARSLSASYPGLPVRPVCSDYTTPFDLPTFGGTSRSIVAYFPGSTIGNFEPGEAVRFLADCRRQCGPRSGMLIGVDLKKDPAILHAAYNDAAGVTADFNRNILRRLNAEADADFDLAAFDHYAFYNPQVGRMEMHLVSAKPQTVRIGDARFRFDEAQSIHTENCYKYTLEGFSSLASAAGFRVMQVWLDERRWFSVQYLASA